MLAPWEHAPPGIDSPGAGSLPHRVSEAIVMNRIIVALVCERRSACRDRAGFGPSRHGRRIQPARPVTVKGTLEDGVGEPHGWIYVDATNSEGWWSGRSRQAPRSVWRRAG